MEFWYDAQSLEVKAVYSDVYNGQTWQDQGYLVARDIEFLPDVGSRILVRLDGQIQVTAPAPPPLPDPKAVRQADLAAILAIRDFTMAELFEWLRLDLPDQPDLPATETKTDNSIII